MSLSEDSSLNFTCAAAGPAVYRVHKTFLITEVDLSQILLRVSDGVLERSIIFLKYSSHGKTNST